MDLFVKVTLVALLSLRKSVYSDYPPIASSIIIDYGGNRSMSCCSSIMKKIVEIVFYNSITKRKSVLLLLFLFPHLTEVLGAYLLFRFYLLIPCKTTYQRMYDITSFQFSIKE